MDVEVRENAADVTVATGDQLVIRVPETTSAGYQWSVEELTGPLELVSSDLTTSGEPAPGAAAERVMKVRATGRGEGRVVLELRRPWERAAPAEEQFRVDVTVA
jgi:inhibitor of cysteine peptidase